jgi:hypothetical protein
MVDDIGQEALTEPAMNAMAGVEADRPDRQESRWAAPTEEDGQRD